MPTYEFKCNECDFLFEEDMPMSKASGAHYGVCPECAEPHPPRYYGSMSFVLKGDGWPSKNIRKGHSPNANNKFEIDQSQRKKSGQKTFDKEIPMSDAEYKRRRKNIERFIDETPKGGRGD